jgi:hypothetical protein
MDGFPARVAVQAGTDHAAVSVLRRGVDQIVHIEPSRSDAKPDAMISRHETSHPQQRKR